MWKPARPERPSSASPKFAPRSKTSPQMGLTLVMVKVTALTEEERKAARAAKFGESGEGGGTEKMKARAARFGIPVNTTTGASVWNPLECESV